MSIPSRSPCTCAAPTTTVLRGMRMAGYLHRFCESQADGLPVGYGLVAVYARRNGVAPDRRQVSDRRLESEIPLVGLRRDELAIGHRLCKGGDDAFGYLSDGLRHRLAIAHGLLVLLRLGCRRLLRRAALSGRHILGRQFVGLFK